MPSGAMSDKSQAEIDAENAKKAAAEAAAEATTLFNAWKTSPQYASWRPPISTAAGRQARQNLGPEGFGGTNSKITHLGPEWNTDGVPNWNSRRTVDNSVPHTNVPATTFRQDAPIFDLVDTGYGENGDKSGWQQTSASNNPLAGVNYPAQVGYDPAKQPGQRWDNIKLGLDPGKVQRGKLFYKDRVRQHGYIDSSKPGSQAYDNMNPTPSGPRPAPGPKPKTESVNRDTEITNTVKKHLNEMTKSVTISSCTIPMLEYNGGWTPEIERAFNQGEISAYEARRRATGEPIPSLQIPSYLPMPTLDKLQTSGLLGPSPAKRSDIPFGQPAPKGTAKRGMRQLLFPFMSSLMSGPSIRS